MKQLLSSLSLFLFSAILFSACNGDGPTSSGNQGLRYESNGDINIMTNFSAVVNTAKVHIDNANPWQDAIGAVMSDAIQTRINDNPTKISDIEISNFRLASVRFRSAWDVQLLKDYLQDASLEFQWFDWTSSTYVGISLGEFNNVIVGDKEVTFNLDYRDLTEIVMENRPDRIFFDLAFNDNPNQDIDITYELFFEFDYKYEDVEDKN